MFTLIGAIALIQLKVQKRRNEKKVSNDIINQMRTCPAINKVINMHMDTIKNFPREF